MIQFGILTFRYTFPHNLPTVFTHAVVTFVIKAVHKFGCTRDNVELVRIFHARGRSQDVERINDNPPAKPAAVLVSFS